MVKIISVNQRGALTLPKEVRDKLGVARGGQLIVDFAESGEVVLRAGVVMPVEIYSAARMKEFKATVRCIPLVDEYDGPGKCIFSGETVDKRVVIAKSY